jgi:NTP pyrophosphatase (non-canonical NTP hydrolase)
MQEVTFTMLREANRERAKEWPGNNQADICFQALELANEAGEVAGKVKKLLRAQRGIGGTTANVEDIALEMGDVLVSLDRLADSLGINLSDAARNKFNETSRKYGMRTRMGALGWYRKD